MMMMYFFFLCWFERKEHHRLIWWWAELKIHGMGISMLSSVRAGRYVPMYKRTPTQKST